MNNFLRNAILTALIAVSVPSVFAATPENCFTYKYGMITDYNSSCGSHVDIPSHIDGTIVWGIGEKAFARKGLTSVTIPAETTDIADYAFYGNNLTSVNLPSTTLGIGTQSFAYNRISSVSIPSGIDGIGEGAFDGNCLTSNAILDAHLGEDWKSEQTCGGTVSPQPTPAPQPTPEPVKPTQPADGGNILFAHFRPSDSPAVVNLDDSQLDGMREQFGYSVATQNTALTRGEFLKIVIDSAGIDISGADLSFLGNYKDVNASDKYARYVAYASAHRIVSGYADNTFRPNGAITRDEATKILVASTGVPVAESASTFTDVDPASTLSLYVQTAYDNKLVNGVNTRDGRLTHGDSPLFAPKRTISAGELFKIVYNIRAAR